MHLAPFDLPLTVAGAFATELSAAFFDLHMPDKAAVETVHMGLRSRNDGRGLSEEELQQKPPKYWARRCRRWLRPEEELLQRLDAVYDKFSATAGFDTAKGTLFTELTPSVHEAAKELVQRGALKGEQRDNAPADAYLMGCCMRMSASLHGSCRAVLCGALNPTPPVMHADPDSPGDASAMYIKLDTAAGNMPRYVCTRGTSQLEGYHAHLNAVLPGKNYSPALAAAIVTTFNYRCWGLRLGSKCRGQAASEGAASVGEWGGHKQHASALH